MKPLVNFIELSGAFLALEILISNLFVPAAFAQLQALSIPLVTAQEFTSAGLAACSAAPINCESAVLPVVEVVDGVLIPAASATPLGRTVTGGLALAGIAYAAYSLWKSQQPAETPAGPYPLYNFPGGAVGVYYSFRDSSGNSSRYVDISAYHCPVQIQATTQDTQNFREYLLDFYDPVTKEPIRRYAGDNYLSQADAASITGYVACDGSNRIPEPYRPGALPDNWAGLSPAQKADALNRLRASGNVVPKPALTSPYRPDTNPNDPALRPNCESALAALKAAADEASYQAARAAVIGHSVHAPAQGEENACNDFVNSEKTKAEEDAKQNKSKEEDKQKKSVNAALQKLAALPGLLVRKINYLGALPQWSGPNCVQFTLSIFDQSYTPDLCFLNPFLVAVSWIPATVATLWFVRDF
jgi:hypothetical protein